MSASITVLRTALPVFLEDLGRSGFGSVGVPASGAYDRAAATLAQRLVGNPETEAGLEITLGEVRLTTSATVTAAVTGAQTPIHVHGAEVAVNEVFSWQAGRELAIGTARSGLRSYLAVHGGFAAHPVLGSASWDVLSALGPAPLTTGQTIGLARRAASDPPVGHAPSPLRDTGVLRVLLGPREAWFSGRATALLASQPFAVTPDSNRVGIRLQGPTLERVRGGELPSEPLQRGAVQVPPNGNPIIMGPDHPTTGGYPVIAAVVASDWDLCGQLRPGDEVRFVVVPAGGLYGVPDSTAARSLC